MSTEPVDPQPQLWCLQYDTESLWKPFLKVSFSRYLNNIISNTHFPAYQQQMARQINDRYEWNEKCWAVIQFFEFINRNFELNEWDDYITFIEDNILRRTLGCFRLWIDTERLYLFNFLKLDSSEFQEDRIFLAMFRTLIYFNSLFSEYELKDFSPVFLNELFQGCEQYLKDVNRTCNNQTKLIVALILKMFENIKNKQTILIEPSKLNSLKKSVKIKVTKEAQFIKEVQQRLRVTCQSQGRRNDQMRIKSMMSMVYIDELTKPMEPTYDPLLRIQNDINHEFFPSQNAKQQKLAQQILKYKRQSRNWPVTDSNAYNSLKQNNHNPYANVNFQLYGEDTKVDMEKKLLLEKVEVTEVVSREDDDQTKGYYEDKFQKLLNQAEDGIGRVTVRDLNRNRKNDNKKDRLKDKDKDFSGKVYNLKWLKNSPETDNKMDNMTTVSHTKDYDNNLLFKSPLDDHMNENNRRKYDQLMREKGCSSLTVANCEQICDDIYPDSVQSSFGSTMFIKKQPQILDVTNWKLVNQNKFDFMRKVIGYMTAQKKIRQMLGDKNIPDYYPRGWPEMKEHWYNPEFVEDKLKFAMGRSQVRSNVFLW